jgi:hypothetical protein
MTSEALMEIAGVPAKAVYLANRHPRLSRAEFAERWRHHGSVGGTYDPRIREVAALRYCVTQIPGDLLPAASDEHDGVALLALRSLVSIPTFTTMLLENEVAYADELRTFERPVQDVTLLTASELIVAGAETSTVVFSFVRRRRDLSPRSFIRASDEDREADLGESGLISLGLRRWVRNVLVAHPPRGFAYEMVNELWFDSLEAVARAAEGIETHLERSELYADRPASLVLVTSVIERIGPDLPG